MDTCRYRYPARLHVTTQRIKQAGVVFCQACSARSSPFDALTPSWGASRRSRAMSKACDQESEHGRWRRARALARPAHAVCCLHTQAVGARQQALPLAQRVPALHSPHMESRRRQRGMLAGGPHAFSRRRQRGVLAAPCGCCLSRPAVVLWHTSGP